MIKRFCNICEAEITDRNKMTPGKLNTPFKKVDAAVAEVRVVVDIKDIHNDEFDVCKYCVLDAISALDDRPKLAHDYT